MWERLAISVCGTVQGVGFRPFVHALANRCQLGGQVRNRSGGVSIEVEGDAESIARFLEELAARPPAAARVEGLETRAIPPRGDRTFTIAESTDCVDARFPIAVAPDLATCDACLRELFDPADRRHRYPFLNCTDCGPRLSIVTSAPYDRPRTSMAGFEMCPACHKEYADPSDRRFHAQPVACPACGPQLRLYEGDGRAVSAADSFAAFAEAIAAGKIGALKGIGGFHLVCRAADSDAVRELRKRKHHDEKPLAVLVRDLDSVRRICHVTPAEARTLTSAARPIVLLRRREDALLPPGMRVADEVAPACPFLGVLLPYTPLHHLLVDALGSDVLVMTSGNRSDEPIAYLDVDATERLAGIADFFLGHNRPIQTRCDDSVVRVVDEQELPLRRSRGYAPQALPLPRALAAPALAVGGQL